jgi:serine protease Do
MSRAKSKNVLFHPPLRYAAIALAMGSLLAIGTSSALADAANYRKALDSTTWVLSKNSEGTSSGTGVLVDAERKLVVTNAHVVGENRSAVIFFRALKDDRPIVEKKHYLENVRKLGIRGRVVAVDRKRDLALVELDRLPEGAKAIELADKSTGPGEGVDSVGNPGTITDPLWVYTSGTVRAVYKKQFRTGAGEHEFMVVETQSPLNSGDSGGPVLDASGKLTGIAQSVAKRGKLISYCVDISEVKDFMSSPWKAAPLPASEVLDQSGMTYETHASGNFLIDMPLKGDKTQRVFVTKNTEYYERADVRKIWSLAATTKEAPDAETSMRLLQQSARTKIGAWTIEQDQQGNYMMIYVVKMDATATGEVLKSTVDYAAKITYAMSKELEPKKAEKSPSDTLASWLTD